MAVLKKTVNCPRRMTVYAIFDVLDKLSSVYEQELAGDITARVNVFDNLNDFALAVTPVSYTHLDVYKRQVHTCPQSRNPHITGKFHKTGGKKDDEKSRR